MGPVLAEYTKKQFTALALCKRGHFGCFLVENTLIWEGKKLGWKRYEHKPVSSLMGSKAPCCSGGLCGTLLLLILYIFLTFTTPKSNIFQFYQNFKHSIPIFIRSENHPKILKKILHNRTPT